jgi:hypothetical protein
MESDALLFCQMCSLRNIGASRGKLRQPEPMNCFNELKYDRRKINQILIKAIKNINGEFLLHPR